MRSFFYSQFLTISLVILAIFPEVKENMPDWDYWELTYNKQILATSINGGSHIDSIIIHWSDIKPGDSIHFHYRPCGGADERKLARLFLGNTIWKSGEITTQQCEETMSGKFAASLLKEAGDGNRPRIHPIFYTFHKDLIVNRIVTIKLEP